MKTFLTLILVCYSIVESNADGSAYDEYGLSAAEIIKLRGFNAENHYLTTSDGYILNIVRATNPLIDGGKAGSKGKDPVLFIHGILTSAKCFLVNSNGIKPADHSRITLTSSNVKEVENLLANDPTKDNLAFLALNFGHEVWLLNRRGNTYSQDYIRNKSSLKLSGTFENEKEPVITSLKSPLYKAYKGFKEIIKGPKRFLNKIDSKYWNYTIDEEARYDFPETVDYILRQTNRSKLAVVGHSLGGCVSLMSLVVYPELNQKISKLVLWAPAVNPGARKKLSTIRQILALFKNRLMTYSGPVTPISFSTLVSGSISILCKISPMSAICHKMNDLVFGYGGNQQSIKPGYMTACPDSTGSHQLAQLVQGVETVRSRHYDYGIAKQNFLAYNQTEPPLYNFSTITNPNISVYYGDTDTFVQYEDVQLFLSDLRVPFKDHFFNQGIYFNHISFFIHKNVSSLVVIPGLLEIES